MSSQTSSPAGPGLTSGILSSLALSLPAPEEILKYTLNILILCIILYNMFPINTYLCTKAYEIAISQNPGEGDLQYAYRLWTINKKPRPDFEQKSAKLAWIWSPLLIVSHDTFAPLEMWYCVWALWFTAIWTVALGGVLGAVVVWQNFQQEFRMLNATVQMWLTIDEVPGTPKVEGMPGAFGQE